MIYTKLDVHIQEGNEHKAAFRTCQGLYEPMVVFFGLTSLLATFQAMTNAIYCNKIIQHEAKGTLIYIYMDDIAITTKHPSLRNHVATVTDVPDCCL